jgi:hypothetical protein
VILFALKERTLMPGRAPAQADDTALVTTAVLRAAARLGLSNRTLARVTMLFAGTVIVHVPVATPIAPSGAWSSVADKLLAPHVIEAPNPSSGCFGRV